MRTLTVFENLTLDGVMQAPALPDEDPRDGFPYGGWAVPYADATMAQFAGEGMVSTGALLLGRRTYEDFAAYWPQQTGGPFAEWLNNVKKYVASTTLREPLAWHNSTLLRGDVPEAVATLKAESDTDILVMGSGVLVQSLMRHGLIDRYLLLIHPLVLGTGRRLFVDGGAYAALTLEEVRTTSTGAVLAVYAAGGAPAG